MSPDHPHFAAQCLLKLNPDLQVWMLSQNLRPGWWYECHGDATTWLVGYTYAVTHKGVDANHSEIPPLYISYRASDEFAA